MKKLTTTLKRKIILWGMTLTLIAIPISAYASYLVEPVDSKPMTLTECIGGIDGSCRDIATITPPPKPRYEVLYNAYRAEQAREQHKRDQERLDKYISSPEYKAYVRSIQG